MIEIILVIGVILLVLIGFSFSLYRIVPPSEAHLVVTPKERFIVSPDETIATNQRRAYFAIPSFIPFIGRKIRIVDMTVKELVDTQETYEKNEARYQVKSSLKYRINDVKKATETFTSRQELHDMLSEVVRASVRAVTVKYDVTETRAKKQLMSTEMQNEMLDDLNGWGLELVNFQLVDFQDTKDSTIISDISKRREVEIQSETRERNAEKIKQAKIKEAESEEKAREREIEKDRTIGERQQLMKQLISEKEKLAQEKAYEVIRVQIIKQTEIDKDQAIIQAEQQRQTEEIFKEKKRLEGEGDRLRDVERAKGEAAPIREKGFAEAEAKEKLQAALNKFKDEAIRALVAEKIVEKDKEIGIAGANALRQAELKVFVGGSTGSDGFELGKMISAIEVSNEAAARASLNKLGVPNDLGFSPKSFVAGVQVGKEKNKKEVSNDRS